MEDINALIYAYSLGCLDNEELRSLKEHLDRGEDYNIQELGEFQNLASLLPSTLIIENPDPQLKDNVAKKLYRLKDEIRAQKQKNKSTINIHEAKGENEYESSMLEPEKLTSEISAFKSTHSEENIVQKMTSGENDLFHDREISHNRPIAPIKKNYKVIISGFVLFVLFVIGIIVIYFNIALKTNKLDNKVEKLKEEVARLNIQLISIQEIEEMLKSPDEQLINLRGTSSNPSSYGKLIIGSNKGAGYLLLAQMPDIPKDNLFQLWVSISGNYLGLKTFQASDTMGFYSFKMFNLPKGEDINFIVTEETSREATTPSNKIYLQGTANP